MLPNAINLDESVNAFFFFLSVGTGIEKEKDTKRSNVFEEEEECVRSEEKWALPCR